MKRLIRFAAAAVSLTAAVSFAQNYPTKPVHMFIGFPAGTSTDILARLLSQKLGDAWAQQVVAENRAGIVLDSFKDIRAGVAQVIARLPELRARVARIENRAVFEIPEILGRLLHADRSRHHAAANHGRAAAYLRADPHPYRETGAPIR